MHPSTPHPMLARRPGGTTSPLFAGWLLLISLACGTSSFTARAETLVVPGSGNPESILNKLAEAFQRRQGTFKIVVPTSTGTAGALRDIHAGTASLARVGRRLSPDEARRGLVYVPLGSDPVVFVAGAAVDVRNVTLRQMLQVYGGQITDWRSLGGRPSPIRAIGREAGDPSLRALGRAEPEFEKIAYGSEVKVVHLDPHLYRLLDRFDTSLAYTNLSGTHAAKSKVTILTLDGVAPTPENVAAGKYPLTIQPGLIYKPDGLTAAGRAFLDYLRSAEAIQILRSNGILPAPVKDRT